MIPRCTLSSSKQILFQPKGRMIPEHPSRDQTNRGYKKTNRNRNIYDPYSFSFNRNRIFQNGIPIRFNRIRIFDFNVPFKRKRIQYFTRIIRLNRISNYLTEFGPNNSVQPNIRSFSQFKRNLLLQA